MKAAARALGVALFAVVAAIWLLGERGRLLLPSSWLAIRAIGLRGLLDVPNPVHLYVYGRWTNQYMAVVINWVHPYAGPRLRKWIAERYHAKVLTPEQARAIVELNHDIPLRDLEQVIPYPLARHLVLQGPPDVAAYECACRHARSSPCQPTQVCMAVGQPFVDFVLEHNPRSARRIDQAEALELLRAEHERGHVHTAWFKAASLGRFYAICNCCRCCCHGVEAMVSYGSPMLASSGYVASVDDARCQACGACAEACPFGAISVGDVAAVSWAKCMGCGVCADRCPHQAIALARDERRGLPLDVREMG